MAPIFLKDIFKGYFCRKAGYDSLILVLKPRQIPIGAFLLNYACASHQFYN